jgi:phosphoribosylaminoimidazolecarboxamide formyltransferase / IMP cyclohydrolase
VTQTTKVTRALISVYDKTGLTELAQGLHEAGVKIVSTGSTAANIAALGIPVTEVKDVTGFPESLDGRVKTLHPKIHGGLLADVRKPDHVAQLSELGIEAFELVVVNLYPFAQTVASGASIEECIEQIDIGGPAMVRASAKNHANVAVVVDPSLYSEVLEAVRADGFTKPQRIALATLAFQHVAQYDVAVSSWLGSVVLPEADPAKAGFPAWFGGVWERAQSLRYGENPHQDAALYVAKFGNSGIAQADQLHGKEMSYNNYVDADAAYRAAYDHKAPTVAIIKHANPCGVASDKDIAQAYQKANATDPVSAFGGVIATNHIVTKEMALAVSDVFTEVIVAPGFDPDALDVLTEKANIRILKVVAPESEIHAEMRPISGGMLLQSQDRFQSTGDEVANWKLVSGTAADPKTLADLEFAWRASRCVKSNGILLAKDLAAVGIGMGQVNRVDSARLAVSRAGVDRAKDSVAASDAFFPFADGLEVLLNAGIRAVVQPGGSVRDEEVIAAANAAGVTMYFTGTRHFFH